MVDAQRAFSLAEAERRKAKSLAGIKRGWARRLAKEVGSAKSRTGSASCDLAPLSLELRGLLVDQALAL